MFLACSKVNYDLSWRDSQGYWEHAWNTVISDRVATYEMAGPLSPVLHGMSVESSVTSDRPDLCGVAGYRGAMLATPNAATGEFRMGFVVSCWCRVSGCCRSRFAVAFSGETSCVICYIVIWGCCLEACLGRVWRSNSSLAILSGSGRSV